MAGESIKSGLTAGFAASALTGALLVIEAQLGIAPEIDPVRDIAAIVDKCAGLKFPSKPGFVVHFLTGTVGWGLLYAWVRKGLPGSRTG